jgi:hypothetical protein
MILLANEESLDIASSWHSKLALIQYICLASLETVLLQVVTKQLFISLLIYIYILISQYIYFLESRDLRKILHRTFLYF